VGSVPREEAGTRVVPPANGGTPPPLLGFAYSPPKGGALAYSPWLALAYLLLPANAGISIRQGGRGSTGGGGVLAKGKGRPLPLPYGTTRGIGGE
jgi:hypothetical protein